MKKIKWYSLDNILKKQGQYYIILGERSNGKSYALNKYIVDNFFKSNCVDQFAYVKRYEEDIKRKYMTEVFTPLQDYIRDEYDHEIKFYQGKFLVYPCGTEGKMSECKVIGTAFSLANVNRTKGTSYPDITTILFEEFMSVTCEYLPDELNLFLNLVSTIVRHRTNVKVFMLANTISKYTPYISALGLKAHRLNKGEIITRTYTDKKGFKSKFVIERTENVNVFDNEENKEKIVYNVFGNSRVGTMITTGDFETHAYNQMVDGYSFNVSRETKSIGKKYKSGFVLQFEDYFYRIYIINDNVKYITAYREINRNSINSNNTLAIINSSIFIEDIINVNNVLKFNHSLINEYLDIIINTIYQNDFIVENDDDGENVINGFRLSGLNYINK